MMGGHGFEMMGMMGFLWLLSQVFTGIVVYFSVKLALRGMSKE